MFVSKQTIAVHDPIFQVSDSFTLCKVPTLFSLLVRMSKLHKTRTLAQIDDCMVFDSQLL